MHGERGKLEGKTFSEKTARENTGSILCYHGATEGQAPREYTRHTQVGKSPLEAHCQLAVYLPRSSIFLLGGPLF